MTPQVISLSAAGSTAWIPVDYKQNPFNISLAVVLSNTPNLTYTVEYTLDNVFNTAITPTVFTVGNMTSATANATGSITVPVKAIRLTISSWTSGTATLTALQGTIINSNWKSTDDLLAIHTKEHAALGTKTQSRLSSSVGILKTFPSSERGSAGTWQTVFMGATDFISVSPIICVTREPTDATYTSDDVYDFIAAAPTNSPLHGGLPDSSEGSAAWNGLANQVFARKVGATPSNPVWVVGNPIPCKSVGRVDGHPGKLALLRAYSAGSGHALASTTRMPTYASLGGDEATLARWDTTLPAAAHAYYYYKTGDYASSNRENYGAASPSRWRYSMFSGCKFHYVKPVVNIMSVGCSLEGGDYNEAGIAVRCSWGVRAAYKLQLEGRAVDHSNVAISGSKWESVGPQLQSLVTSLCPDVLLLPAYNPNGVSAGVGAGTTINNAYLQLQQAIYYADWALDNGVKNVVFLMPLPWLASVKTVQDYIKETIRSSGHDYFDPTSIVGDTDGSIKSIYTDDTQHPNALANDLIAASLTDTLRKYAPYA